MCRICREGSTAEGGQWSGGKALSAGSYEGPSSCPLQRPACCRWSGVLEMGGSGRSTHTSPPRNILPVKTRLNVKYLRSLLSPSSYSFYGHTVTLLVGTPSNTCVAVNKPPQKSARWGAFDNEHTHFTRSHSATLYQTGVKVFDLVGNLSEPWQGY